MLCILSAPRPLSKIKYNSMKKIIYKAHAIWAIMRSKSFFLAAGKNKEFMTAVVSDSADDAVFDAAMNAMRPAMMTRMRAMLLEAEAAEKVNELKSELGLS